MDRALRPTAGTLQTSQCKKRTLREQQTVLRVKIKIHSNPRHGGKEQKNDMNPSHNQENQLNGSPVKMLTGAHISPRTNATIHHVRAELEALTAPS